MRPRLGRNWLARSAAPKDLTPNTHSFANPSRCNHEPRSTTGRREHEFLELQTATRPRNL
ncbi:hypothetical protein YC2023_036724 [Brassica napus]